MSKNFAHESDSIDPAAVNPFPTRASLRRAAQSSASGHARRSISAAQEGATAPQRKGEPRESRWRSIRSLVVMALVVPGMFGTIALPAYAFETTPAATTSPVYDTGAQSLIVTDWAGETVARDSYSATTPEELSAAKAALAAAAAQAAAAARAASAKSSAGSSGSGGYSYSASDPELAAFLVGKTDTWIRPVAAGISSPYGPRGLICNGAGCSNSFHDGIDFGTSCGTPVKAVSAGRVTFTGNAGSYGNRVIVDHGNGVASIYGHLQNGSFKVSVGDLIEAGTVVAGVGATGVVTACHLDLKIGINGSFTSPVPYLASRGLRL
ncbi:M23 family metallopeptidase [Mycetocola zhadangensis]|uniref:M23 family metallopeptidase n=1 Tax=Mycetocola zhadangensis TaxID=1164595 RepID=UPI003A4D46EB